MLLPNELHVFTRNRLNSFFWEGQVFKENCVPLKNDILCILLLLKHKLRVISIVLKLDPKRICSLWYMLFYRKFVLVSLLSFSFLRVLYHFVKTKPLFVQLRSQFFFKPFQVRAEYLRILRCQSRAITYGAARPWWSKSDSMSPSRTSEKIRRGTLQSNLEVPKVFTAFVKSCYMRDIRIAISVSPLLFGYLIL